MNDNEGQLSQVMACYGKTKSNYHQIRLARKDEDEHGQSLINNRIQQQPCHLGNIYWYIVCLTVVCDRPWEDKPVSEHVHLNALDQRAANRWSKSSIGQVAEQITWHYFACAGQFSERLSTTTTCWCSNFVQGNLPAAWRALTDPTRR